MGHIPDLDDAYALVARLVDAAAPGSLLILSHAVMSPHGAAAQDDYNQSAPLPYLLRTPAQIGGFFKGLGLVEPGLVPTPDWRPDPTTDTRPLPGVGWGAVARIQLTPRLPIVPRPDHHTVRHRRYAKCPAAPSRPCDTGHGGGLRAGSPVPAGRSTSSRTRSVPGARCGARARQRVPGPASMRGRGGGRRGRGLRAPRGARGEDEAGVRYFAAVFPPRVQAEPAGVTGPAARPHRGGRVPAERHLSHRELSVTIR
ncbi:SAM-dependent methyltransferase [Streptomyces lushanensis]|uniref:SAM-dependent methyltransferase n=1 Tax=Streptomyces lushanensis TaxID=1434255 RepID=UPI003CCB75AE